MADIRKVGLIAVRNERVLLCRKRGGKRLILPGGKREPGETSLETLTRELREELGPVALENPVLLGTYLDQTAPEDWAPPRSIEIEVFGGTLVGEPRASREIEAVLWFGESDGWATLAPSLSRQIFPDLIERHHLPWRRDTVI